ncbi:MAG: DNA recombination/repair protein RecA, partial [Pseudobdellovibrionaceae bacterium]
VKVVKNKMAPPFTKVEFDLMYGTGISLEGDILDLAVTANIVEKAGAWFSYGGERLGQGRDQAKTTLKENPTMREEIRQKILSHNGIGTLLLAVEETTPAADLELTPPPPAGKKKKEVALDK